MNALFLLFLFIVATCQAYLSPLYGQPVTSHPLYEEIRELIKKYMLYGRGHRDPLLIIVPDGYRQNPAPIKPPFPPVPIPAHFVPYRDDTPVYFKRYPDFYSRYLIEESDHIRQETEPERLARLAKIDEEVLNNLSVEDKITLESGLTKEERLALLGKLEDGELNEILTQEDNRFSMGDGLTSAAVQIGTTAGGYLGFKLAGALGAKLGAAAGAYLGQAAANSFLKKKNNVVNNVKGPDGLRFS